MKNDIRSTIQRVAVAVTAGLLLVAGVQQMRAGQQTRSAAHPPDWTNKVIEEKIWKLLEDHKSVFVHCRRQIFGLSEKASIYPMAGRQLPISRRQHPEELSIRATWQRSRLKSSAIRPSGSSNATNATTWIGTSPALSSPA